jgi:hypothetical protein
MAPNPPVMLILGLLLLGGSGTKVSTVCMEVHSKSFAGSSLPGNLLSLSSRASHFDNSVKICVKEGWTLNSICCQYREGCNARLNTRMISDLPNCKACRHASLLLTSNLIPSFLLAGFSKSTDLQQRARWQHASSSHGPCCLPQVTANERSR